MPPLDDDFLSDNNPSDLLADGMSVDIFDGKDIANVGSLVFDLTDVSTDTEIKPIPAGKYECIVEALTFGKSKAGNPMVTAKFKVIGTEYAGTTLMNWYTLMTGDKPSAQGQGNLKKLILITSPEYSLERFNPEAWCNSGESLGQPLVCTVKITLVDGKKRNQVDDISTSTQAAGDGMPF